MRQFPSDGRRARSGSHNPCSSMIVDAPSGKGHVLLFATNPIYRWQTFGEYGMVFNALMFWNDFPAEAPAAPKPDAAVQ